MFGVRIVALAATLLGMAVSLPLDFAEARPANRRKALMPKRLANNNSNARRAGHPPCTALASLLCGKSRATQPRGSSR